MPGNQGSRPARLLREAGRQKRAGDPPPSPREPPLGKLAPGNRSRASLPRAQLLLRRRGVPQQPLSRASSTSLFLRPRPDNKANSVPGDRRAASGGGLRAGLAGGSAPLSRSRPRVAAAAPGPARPRAGGRAPRPPPHLQPAAPRGREGQAAGPGLRPAPAGPQPHLCSVPAHPRTPARTPSPGCGWPAADPARSRPWLPAPRSPGAPGGRRLQARALRRRRRRPQPRPLCGSAAAAVPSLSSLSALRPFSPGPAVALSPLAPGPLALRRSRLAFPPPHPSAPLLPQPAPARRRRRRRRRLLSGAPGRAGSPPLSPPPPPPGASSARGCSLLGRVGRRPPPGRAAGGSGAAGRPAGA